MGSFVNFKNFGSGSQQYDQEKLLDNFSLVRQPSVFSLTFDEFQSTLGGPQKDFGSMNMEDLLKNIWTAEESQSVGACAAGGGQGGVFSGNLQRQGSLTLPRTLSQKTVDEVWRDVLKETLGVKEETGAGEASLRPREPTLGEMTLEEFLSRAGVVREDVQPSGEQNSAAGIYGAGFAAGFQTMGVMGSQFDGNSNVVLNSPNIGIDTNGANLSGTQHSQVRPLYPKQTTIAFSTPSQLGNNGQLYSPETKSPVVAMTSPLSNTGRGGVMAIGGLSSPTCHLHSDSIVSKTDTQSLSPVPYNFGEGGRGRRSSNSLEKVVERRRRRMIKNRESAARSRARKQAYTLELEAEIAKLKEMNQELQKKQEEFMEMQKNQSLETMNLPLRGKRICLKRTLTGPW